MWHESITVTPMSPNIGAEIGNIDLTQPLSNRQVQELHQARRAAVRGARDWAAGYPRCGGAGVWCRARLHVACFTVPAKVAESPHRGIWRSMARIQRPNRRWVWA
jgi:hypothetical protein